MNWKVPGFALLPNMCGLDHISIQIEVQEFITFLEFVIDEGRVAVIISFPKRRRTAASRGEIIRSPQEGQSCPMWAHGFSANKPDFQVFKCNNFGTNESNFGLLLGKKFTYIQDTDTSVINYMVIHYPLLYLNVNAPNPDYRKAFNFKDMVISYYGTWKFVLQD